MSYFVACLLVLVGVLFTQNAHAATKDIDLVAAYHILFPEKSKTVKEIAPQFSSPIIKIKPTIKKRKTFVKDRVKPIQKMKSVSKLVDNVINKQSTTTLSQVLEKQQGDNKQKNKVTDLSTLFAKAFGKKAGQARPSKISVELRINKTVLGDVTVFSNKQGTIDSVGAGEFLTILKDVVKEQVYKKVSNKTSKRKKLPFILLSKFGVGASYNSVDLSLDLTIDSALRKPLILSMLSKRKASVRDENKITAAEISGFLNMYSTLGISSGGSKPDVNLKFEGSLNLGKTTLESTLNVRNGKFSTEHLRLTYDKPEKLQRFVLGDISTGSKNFQENLRLTGLRVSKEFYMNPELQIRPRANESFVLDTDSEVEVFINNQMRQRFHLRAGIYSLEDIGLYDGANNIRVRIKDEFGKITEKTSQQFYASSLLKKDLSVYAFSVGYLSKKQAGSSNNLIKDPILSGYYQKGLRKDLTMGVDVQISANSYLLGAEAVNSASLGILKSSIAISGGNAKGSGAAARFEFRPNLKHNNKLYKLLSHKKGFIKGWSVAGELRSKNFLLLNGSDTIDVKTGEKKGKALRAKLQANMGLELGDKWRGGLNLALNDYHDSKSSASINLSLNRRIRNSIDFSVAARYDSDDDFAVNMQISIPLSSINKHDKVKLDLQTNSKTNSLGSKLTLSPHSLIGRNSLEGSLEVVKNDAVTQQKFNMGYRGVNYKANLQAQNSRVKSSDRSVQRLKLGFNSSLACVGKHCATSYPIHDSFALVSGPSNQTTPIAINNGNSRFVYSNDSGLPDNYTALIPSKNKRAVIGLDSYRYQSINIDESTLPNGYDVEKTEFEVFPRYHQGFAIKAGGEPATILNGFLMDENNLPLGFKGGQWIPTNGKGKTIAFFSNKAGRFRVMSVPAGKYKLELFDYPDMQTVYINVPDLKGKVHDLGRLKVVE